MDDKLDFDFKNKKNAPKKGRRAGLGFFMLNSKDTGTLEENGNEDLFSSRLRDNKSSSWSDETLKLNIEENKNAVKDFDDGIPIIPNLEDADDKLIGKVAKAPLVGVNRVASYKELENDLLKNTAFANLEEVNLHILTDFIYPESALLEPDEPWTKEFLLSKVISAMNNEKEKEILQQSLISQ